MADKNKVTIDAEWFAELWKKANEADKVCEDCVREKCGECKVVKERDELKSAISRMEKSVEKMRENDLRELEAVRKERDELKAKLKEIEEQYGNKCAELATCIGENNELKAELEEKVSIELAKCTAKDLHDRLAAAERCIEDCERDLEASLVLDDEYSPTVKSALAIIRAYREKKEGK